MTADTAIEPNVDRPEDLKAILGTSPTAPDVDQELLSAITKDLEVTQGHHRQRSFIGKTWPLILAAVLSMAFVTWRIDPKMLFGGAQLASLTAMLASVLSYIAVALAPERPGASERLAFGVVVLALLSFGGHLLVIQNIHFDFSDLGLGCTGKSMAVGLVPFGLALFAIVRTRLPVRPLHLAAVVISAFSFSCAAIWLLCPGSGSTAHVAAGHVLIPIIIGSLLVVVGYRLINRQSDLSL